jgi:hypothetical protein
MDPNTVNSGPSGEDLGGNVVLFTDLKSGKDPKQVYDPRVIADLAKSGLTPEELDVQFLNADMRRSIGALNADGYKIPYYTIRGAVIDFYRVKVFNSNVSGSKYRQPTKSNNHIYFPPAFYATLIAWVKKWPQQAMLVITEGEKKAACATKMGIPTVGLGGVDSWKSRTISLPKEVELTSNKQDIKAKLPGSNTRLPEMMTLAEGFQDMMDVINQFNITPVLIFDSDIGGTMKADIQRSLTMLGYELRYLGLPATRIRQLILPDIHNRPADAVVHPDEDTKTGLDDYLMIHGPSQIIREMHEIFHDPTKFPRHPNSKGFLGTQLNNFQDRKLAQQIGHVIMAELDSDGMRFRDTYSGQPYYYNRETYKLMPATILNGRGQFMHETPFGVLLYQRFGLGAGDIKVLTWLASQFTGEEPIVDVTPRRVRALVTEKEDPTNPNGIAIQVGDSNFITVSSSTEEPIKLCTNGDLGLLFEQNHVEPLDVDTVLEAFEQINAEPGPLAPWWWEILQDTNIGRNLKDLQTAFPDKNPDEVDSLDIPISPQGHRMRELATLLYYISPWLQRWKGIQLPVEIMIGGPGSGKSSLYEMRLNILTGRPHLRNLPNDIKDWQASLANSGGLHVIDNVHFTKNDLKQRMSDEICRLTTEPHPTIEVRQLYTTADLIRFPVDVTFGFTAVTQPFQNADLFSRSTIFETCNLGKAPDSDWVRKKMELFGGREMWMAHQLVFLHRFFKLAAKPVEEGGWDENFHTIHRLANLEQALGIAARVVGMDKSFVRKTVKEIQLNASTDSDWVLQGIIEFTTNWREGSPQDLFTMLDIVAWVEMGEFRSNPILSNARRLDRYFKAHYSLIASTAGVRMAGEQSGQQTYRVTELPTPKPDQADTT